MEVPPEEFKLPFFKENGFERKFCPHCKNYYWTQDHRRENCGDSPCVPYSFIGNSPMNRRYTVKEMREKFLSFFELRGHKRIAPYPVIARWRDDLMVTIASIVDFQPYVTEGILPPPANPLVISQPCLRFEDIDLVGKTAGRHLTIFEMGGHHAFNYKDEPQIYWKDETVRYHHELLTRDLGVPSEAVTYKEGLWSGGGNAGFDLEGCVNGLEISTLVFMMFRIAGAKFEPMPIQVVDTGYGIERWTWLSQGSPSAFHAIYGNLLSEALEWVNLETLDEETMVKITHYLKPQSLGARNLKHLSEITKIDGPLLSSYLESLESVYAALDHTKSLVFILSEGVIPSNVREGYLARLLYRRAFRLMRRGGVEDKLHELIEGQIRLWGNDFPQLVKMKDEIMESVEAEGGKYRETLRRGSEMVKRMVKSKKGGLTKDHLIDFYDSHGLTPEDVKEAAHEIGVEVPVPEDFYTLVARRHMNIERQVIDEEMANLSNKVETMERTETLFYSDPYLIEFEDKVVSVIDDEYVILKATAFFAEAGGQISDRGWIIKNLEKFPVTDVKAVNGVILHKVEKAGKLKPGDRVKGLVDWVRRTALMRSHTATHIILGAARRVVGEHAWQAGAQKGVERSRLDINHFRRLSIEQIESIERLANQIVMEGRAVTCKFMPRNEAEAEYGFRLYQGGVVPGREIRVVNIADWDVEACGGTHVRNTSEIGLIKITDTERVQDGVERIIFAVGPYAFDEVQKRDRILGKTAEILGVQRDHITKAVQEMVNEVKSTRQKLTVAMRRLARLDAEALLNRSKKMNDLNIIICVLEEESNFLIEIVNELVKQTDKVVAVLGSKIEPKVIVKSGEEAVSEGIHAGRLASEVAELIGGRGGGDHRFGQAGGGDPKKLEKETERVLMIIQSMLKDP
ncbi:alanine--tRNA ligase [Candidatus Bathyarchaeota archaeon]|nr:alanine--tRNA ligase [Candidatus Bathyarchaeota archaeon]